MCDRILILAANPGRICAELPVPLPQPRNRQDPAFHAVVDEIYSILTAHPKAVGQRPGVAQVLPHESPLAICAVAEALAAAPHDGQADLRELARAHIAHAPDMLPIAEALQILEFAELKDGRIRLTAGGRVFAGADREGRKRLFKEHLVRFVPLAAHIQTVLQERKTGPAPRARFESELEDTLGPRDANRTLDTVIGWGRYAELFDYDDRRRMFRVSNER